MEWTWVNRSEDPHSNMQGPMIRDRQFGTSFIFNMTIRSLLGYETINDRICRVRLMKQLRNMTLISAHAPTEQKSEDEK